SAKQTLLFTTLSLILLLIVVVGIISAWYGQLQGVWSDYIYYGLQQLPEAWQPILTEQLAGYTLRDLADRLAVDMVHILPFLLTLYATIVAIVTHWLARRLMQV